MSRETIPIFFCSDRSIYREYYLLLNKYKRHRMVFFGYSFKMFSLQNASVTKTRSRWPIGLAVGRAVAAPNDDLRGGCVLYEM